MYDVPTLVSILKEIGFDARGMHAFESRIPDINRIEMANRTMNAVIVEGTKKMHRKARLRQPVASPQRRPPAAEFNYSAIFLKQLFSITNCPSLFGNSILFP